MKRLVLVLTVALAAILIAPAGSNAQAGFGREITFDAFYSALGPLGEWITVDAGVYAWRPLGVVPDWRPYWSGRWIWTDDGWYWDSDEPWAWATYHYGRWYFDDYYGWIWTPGYEWAPAWVEWRHGGDYVGWAPLGPYAMFNFHFGIYYSHRWSTPYHYWSFVDCHHMMHHHVNEYVYRTEHNPRFIGQTRRAGSVDHDRGRLVSRGPDVREIERRGDIRVPRTRLVDVESNDQLRGALTRDRAQIGVYRPRVGEGTASGRSGRPDNLRDRERMPSLDTRQMDVRRGDVARESGRQSSGSVRQGEQRSGDRNSRWFEVNPSRSGEDVNRSAQQGSRNGGYQDRSAYDRRAGQRREGVSGGSQQQRSQDRSSVERRSEQQQRSLSGTQQRSQERPTLERRAEPQQQRSLSGTQQRSQERSSGERMDRPSVRQQSEGSSSGRSAARESGGGSGDRSPSRGRGR
jgi:hypothetical protein